MSKKILSVILAVMTVLVMLTSCSDGVNGDSNEKIEKVTETAGVSDSHAETGVGYNKYIREYVEGLADSNDFDGKNFTWIGGGSQAPKSDEFSGNVLDDALFHRQRDIVEIFGIKWENYSPAAVENSVNHPIVDAVIQDKLANAGAYDAGYGTPIAVLNPLFTEDCLNDISTVSGIDFEREWWPEGYRESNNIEGRMYYVGGPIVTSYYTDASSVFFNKNITEAYEVEDIYALVKNNKWTFDKMFEIAETIPENTDGSGIYRYAKPDGVAVIVANGLTITKFNENNAPYVPDKYPNEIAELSAKFAPVFSNDALTVNTKGILTGNYEVFEEKYGYADSGEMFADGKVLFCFTTTGEAAAMRDKSVDFGILPMPLGSDSQESYRTYGDTWSMFNVFIPTSAKDKDFSGVILEAMAALSSRYVKEAYYDVILRSDGGYDYETQDIIDTIFDSKVYDMIEFISYSGTCNCGGGHDIVKVLKGAIQETSDGISSKYDMQARLVNIHINEILSDMES